ncbi:hypothetical protein [Oerskovia enterophila]|uniref:Uncharacterized protein n=1 Tax=Oerskovia enterophila TaxID=43678 RepID=A0A163QTR1_9CELL|nr:hypothetical protein [Oerskovia enterophila]KZM34519.1 hypothetical protein OJAG_28180 [Oerskovia enterophila]
MTAHDFRLQLQQDRHDEQVCDRCDAVVEVLDHGVCDDCVDELTIVGLRVVFAEPEPVDLDVPVEYWPTDEPAPAASPLGIVLVFAVALVLMLAGLAVAWTAPRLSGGHLIAGPGLVIAGGALIGRLLTVRGW